MSNNTNTSRDGIVPLVRTSTDLLIVDITSAVQRFRADLVQRLRDSILKRAQLPVPVERPYVVVPVPRKGPTPRVRQPFNVPARGVMLRTGGRETWDRKAPVRHAPPGTKRAMLESLLSGRGATLATVMETIGWDRRLALANIRAMDRLGYGIREGRTGRIRLVVPG